ncbi:MAG: hypothetical protein SGI77_19850 [Pirellulaceae bacterium]|nr:hypothetical protein [Pirellulaceae bacterium]
MKTSIPKRRGISLLEMVVISSITAGLISLSAVIIQKSYFVHEQSVRDWGAHRSLQSLYERWREDIHTSESIDMETPSVLSILGKNRIVYRIDGNNDVARQVWINDVLVGVDEYRFGLPMQLRFSRDTTGAVELIRMNVNSKVDGGVNAFVTVFARLGTEHLTKSLEPGERHGASRRYLLSKPAASAQCFSLSRFLGRFFSGAAQGARCRFNVFFASAGRLAPYRYESERHWASAVPLTKARSTLGEDSEARYAE